MAFVNMTLAVYASKAKIDSRDRGTIPTSCANTVTQPTILLYPRSASSSVLLLAGRKLCLLFFLMWVSCCCSSSLPVKGQIIDSK